MRNNSTTFYNCIFVAICGPLFGIIAIILQFHISKDSAIRTVFTVINYPIFAIIDWMADKWHHGDTDHLIPQAMVLAGIYWVFIGIVISLCLCGIANLFMRSVRSVRS